MENINIEKIYNEETNKYNFYVNGEQVDFVKFYMALKDEYFKELDNKENSSDYKINFVIKAQKFQNLYDTIKSCNINYVCGDYTFRIAEK